MDATPGELGRSKENPKNPFEIGKVDTFDVQSPDDLGALKKIRLSHDGKVL
jgi:hypothetical protein